MGITSWLLGSALVAGQAPMPLPQAAPMAMPMAQAAPMPPAPAAPCAACDEAKKEEEAKTPATKYFLEKLLEGSRAGQLLSDRGITIQGWTNLSYTASSTSRDNLPTTFNDRANAFQMNQTWLDIAKPTDPTKKELQFGFRTSFLYGTDYRFTLPRGLYNDQLNRGQYYGFDPVYGYGEVFLPNLGSEGTTIRVGRIPTTCSYEVIDAVSTPFLAKSYTFQYNPFTHTGIQAITQINETWSMYHGAITGNDVYIDPAAQLAYLGGVKWAPKDGKTSVALNTVITDPRYNQREAFAHYNIYNVVLTHKVSDDLTYVLDAAYSHNYNNPGVGAANWYGVANYFLYKVCDKLQSNLRLEAFNDTKGVRTGFEGIYYEATYGVSYTPKPWLVVRPTVRYDYNVEGRPFEGDHHLFTATMDVIIRF